MVTLPKAALAQTCGIAGWDGPATPGGVVNSYHAGAAATTANSGSNQVTVASSAGQRTSNRSLRAGDMVLIVQMQHAGTPANAGLYDCALIRSIAGSACPGPRTNTAVITSPAIGDSVPANNSATAVTSVGCATTLTVEKTDGVAAVVAGSTTLYTVTFSNLGPAAADGAVVSDAPGAGLNCTSVTCSAVTGGPSRPAGLPLGVPTPIGSTTFFGAGSVISQMPSVSTVALAVSCGVTGAGK